MKTLNTKWAGQPVIEYETTDSTNIRAKVLAEANCCHGTLITAQEQTAGKGRLGRSWKSPKGTSVSMSLILQPRIAPEHASMLTLAAALALRKAIAEETGLDVQIKWPNDIVCQGKKLCGILTEMSTEQNRIRHVIIGMGINTNVTDFPAELPHASSLKLLTGRTVEGEPLIEGTMQAFEQYYDKFLQTEDLSALKKDYEAVLAGIGQPVRVLAQTPYTGISRGITADGSLLVETEQGLQSVCAGEVSVRGIYGYAPGKMEIES